MATIYARLVSVQNQPMNGGPAMPVPDAVPFGKETLTSTGTTATGTLVGGNGLYWFIDVLAGSGSAWAQFGATPTAAVGSDFLLVDGEHYEFSARPDQKMAVISG